MHRFRRGLRVACVALLGLTSLCIEAADVRTIDDAVYTKPSVLVPVEGARRLNLFCLGTGQPVVIFEAGLGDSTKSWALVQPEIAKHTMACAYDRAGLGFSDPAIAPGTSSNAVADLKKMLAAAKLPPPYILVGHSYGGMVVKHFAFLYPSDVAGLILVEPSQEDIGKTLFELDPPSLAANQKYRSDLEECSSVPERRLTTDKRLNELCVGHAGPRYGDRINEVELALASKRARAAAWTSEMQHVWFESADQVRNVRHVLGHMPLIVLTKPPSTPAPNETSELRAKKNRVITQLQDATAALSSRGRHLVVDDTGHYIQLDQPEAVAVAIVEVLDILVDRTGQNER